MEKMTKNFKYAALAGIVALLSPIFALAADKAASSTASSSDAGTADQTCELNQALDTLLAIKDSNIDTQLKAQAELDARKKLLEQTVICSENEMGSLRDRVNGLSLSSDNEKNLKDSILKDLDAAASYYKEQDKKITDKASLDDVKQQANDVLAWRASFYNPLVLKVNDFYLITAGGQSIKTAESRFQKIQNTLNALGLGNVEKIQSLLNDSAGDIRDAKEASKEASGLFWNNINNPSSTPTTTTLSVDASSSPTSTTEKTPLSLMQTALLKIKAAYNNYLTISDVVKKILGLE